MIPRSNYRAYLGSAKGFTGFELVTDFTIVWVILIAIAGGLFFFTNSPWELTFRSVRDDPIAAEAIGISPRTARIITLAIGAAISGFAGILLAHWLTIVQPSNFKFTESLDLLVFVAIGGRESFLGAVAGALFLTILSEELRFSAQFRLILFGASLTLVMMILPGGLIGRWSAGTNPVQAVLMMFRPVVELVQSATKRTLYSFTYIVRSARRRLSYEAREGPDQKSD